MEKVSSFSKNEAINTIISLDKDVICIGGFRNIYIYDTKNNKNIYTIFKAHFSNISILKLWTDYLLSGKFVTKEDMTDIFVFIASISLIIKLKF